MEVKMKKVFRFLISCLFLFLLAGCGTQQEEQPERKETSLFAMGTYIRMTAYGENAETALDESSDRIQELEALWSVTEESSEISAANRSMGEPVPVSEETAELLRYAVEMAEQTDGAFEPTIYPVVDAWGFTSHEYRIPSGQELPGLLQNVGYEKIHLEDGRLSLAEGAQLDLGAVGKGFTGDIVAGLLEEGASHLPFWISAGTSTWSGAGRMAASGRLGFEIRLWMGVSVF